jgi:hypothetical protein
MFATASLRAAGGWKNTRGWKAAHAEADLPTTAHDAEVAKGLVYGLPGASSIEDRNIPTFSRGELPHFAGINTFMKVSAAVVGSLSVLHSGLFAC